MSRKAKTVNNIDTVNVEIDYDKLAEAIVRATKKAEEEDRKNTKVRRILITGLNGLVFVLFYLISAFGIVSTWVRFAKGVGFSLVVSIILSLLCLVSVVVTFLCQLEALKDDYKDAMSLFTTNIALIALIVAVVALLKA